jgi:hypothetical protein
MVAGDTSLGPEFSRADFPMLGISGSLVFGTHARTHRNRTGARNGSFGADLPAVAAWQTLHDPIKAGIPARIGAVK